MSTKELIEEEALNSSLEQDNEALSEVIQILEVSEQFLNMPPKKKANLLFRLKIPFLFKKTVFEAHQQNQSEG